MNFSDVHAWIVMNFLILAVTQYMGVSRSWITSDGVHLFVTSQKCVNPATTELALITVNYLLLPSLEVFKVQILEGLYSKIHCGYPPRQFTRFALPLGALVIFFGAPGLLPDLMSRSNIIYRAWLFQKQALAFQESGEVEAEEA